MLLTILGAFAAGVLTILAPCVLPLLPVIIGGSVVSDSGTTEGSFLRRHQRALIITASLTASVVLFTLLLRASTAALSIPAATWQYLSGGLLIALGLVAVFPHAWDTFAYRTGLSGSTAERLTDSARKPGTLGAILTGAALGPVFSSCSPLYVYVVVTVLPASWGEGLLLLSAYAIGLSGAMLAIAVAGARIMPKLTGDRLVRWRRILGVIFVLIGVAIIMGWDRDLQTWVIMNSPVQPWLLDSGWIPS